jgi:hypothetical protein
MCLAGEIPTEHEPSAEAVVEQLGALCGGSHCRRIDSVVGASVQFEGHVVQVVDAVGGEEPAFHAERRILMGEDASECAVVDEYHGPSQAEQGPQLEVRVVKRPERIRLAGGARHSPPGGGICWLKRS